MIKLTSILIFFILALAIIVVGTVTYTINAPDNYEESTSTSMLFNWTPVTTVDTVVTSYLYITTSGNESNLVINQTLECTNATSCNVTVSDFSVGFYKWYVRSLDNQQNATVVGTVAAPFVTTTNNSLNITYTVDAVVENCLVSFTPSATLSIAEAITNITTTAGCNLTAKNVSGLYLNLTTKDHGADEYITINSAGSNASGVFGITKNTTTYGTSTNSSTPTRWFEIKDTTNETYFRWGSLTSTVMWLNRDTGDLNITGDFNGNLTWTGIETYPAACPANSAITTLGDSVTCTDGLYTTHGASNITAGTYPAGNFVYTDNVTVECIIFASGGSICSA